MRKEFEYYDDWGPEDIARQKIINRNYKQKLIEIEDKRHSKQLEKDLNKIRLQIQKNKEQTRLKMESL
jgi:hypothetical protein